MVRIHRICHRLRHDGWRSGNEGNGKVKTEIGKLDEDEDFSFNFKR